MYKNSSLISKYKVQLCYKIKNVHVFSQYVSTTTCIKPVAQNVANKQQLRIMQLVNIAHKKPYSH